MASKIGPKQINWGCYGCSKSCAMCKSAKNKQNTNFLLRGNYIICNKTNASYKIKQIFNCNSTHLIYSLLCINCGMQSVGSTMDKLKSRFAKHKSDIINNKKGGCNLVQHFNNPRLKCYDKNNKVQYLRVMAFDGLTIDDQQLTYKVADGRLNALEINWQGKFISIHRGGNNTKDYNNVGYNRRNYTEKHRKSSDKIILNRNIDISNDGRLWNKTWSINGNKYQINLETLTKSKQQKCTDLNFFAK